MAMSFWRFFMSTTVRNETLRSDTLRGDTLRGDTLRGDMGRRLSLRLASLGGLSAVLLACSGGSGDGIPGIRVNRDIPVNIAVSDAAVTELSEVVVTITEIEFTDDSGEKTSITQFYDANTGENTAESFTVDLLDYQGAATAKLLDQVMLTPGTYDKVTLHVADESFNTSYGLTQAGEQKLLKVPSDRLQLGGFTLTADQRDSTWVIEFDLRTAMTYNPTPERYILKPRGIRIQNQRSSATLSGIVDLNFFGAQASCGDNKVVYLYDAAEFDGFDITNEAEAPVTDTFTLSQAEVDIVTGLISDQFDPVLDDTAPEGAVRPFASVDVDASGNYTIAFLPTGNYVALFSCTAAADDANQYDALSLADFPEHFTHVYLGVDEQGVGEEEQLDLPRL
jgi:hypothetical protein